MTIPRGSLLLFALLGSQMMAGPVDGAVVRLKERIEPEGALLRLADVAEISDPDPAVVARLGAVTLMPANGKTVRVDFDLIRSRLIAHGVNLAEIEFTGQNIVTVSASTVVETRIITPRTPPEIPQPKPAPVSPSQQERAQTIIREAFERRFRNAHTGDIDFILTTRVRDEDVARLATVPPSAIRFAERSLIEGGPQPLTLAIADPSGTQQEYRVAAWLERKARVLTVRHVLPKDHILQPQDLQWKPAKDGEAGIAALADAVGRATSRTVKPGETLQVADLSVVALVRGGDIVSVQVKAPGIVVRRQFKAMGAGGLDEVVTLVALDDPRERIQARVTAFHEAEMIAPSRAGSPRPAPAVEVQFVPAPRGERP